MISPIEMVNLLRGRNPQEFAMTMIKNNNINDPMITQLIQLAQNGDINSLTQTAQDLFAKQGRNFNQEFSDLMSLLK